MDIGSPFFPVKRTGAAGKDTPRTSNELVFPRFQAAVVVAVLGDPAEATGLQDMTCSVWQKAGTEGIFPM